MARGSPTWDAWRFIEKPTRFPQKWNYLRAAIVLLPEAGVKLAYAADAAGTPAVLYQQTSLLNGLSNHLLHIEVMRDYRGAG